MSLNIKEGNIDKYLLNVNYANIRTVRIKRITYLIHQAAHFVEIFFASLFVFPETPTCVFGRSLLYSFLRVNTQFFCDNFSVTPAPLGRNPLLAGPLIPYI